MTTTGKKRAEKRTEEAKAEAHRVLIKSEWEVIEEEEEVVMRHTKEEDGEVEQEQAERDVTMNVEEEGAKEAAAEIQEDAEDTDEKEEDDNVAGMPVRLRINSFVNCESSTALFECALLFATNTFSPFFFSSSNFGKASRSLARPIGCQSRISSPPGEHH